MKRFLWMLWLLCFLPAVGFSVVIKIQIASETGPYTVQSYELPIYTSQPVTANKPFTDLKFSWFSWYRVGPVMVIAPVLKNCGNQGGYYNIANVGYIKVTGGKVSLLYGRSHFPGPDQYGCFGYDVPTIYPTTVKKEVQCGPINGIYVCNYDPTYNANS